jgi:hypothetical protein
MATHFALTSGLLPEAAIVGMAQDFRIIAGIYFLIDKDRIVYVGQSNNIYARVRRHAHQRQKPFSRFSFIEVPLDQLTAVESAYIRHFRPKYNMTSIGILRTPDNGSEVGLNRGYSDRVSPEKVLAAYNAKWDRNPDEWIRQTVAKLNGEVV